jgi:branched-chain amino acid transport system ATP-binding protein
MLELGSVSTGYGRVRALEDISLTLDAGQTLAVLGPNGAGKSTLLKLIVGVQPPWSGSLRLDGSTDLRPLDATARVLRGIVLCPEGRRIFTTLSVEENLRIGGTALLARPDGARRLRDGLERAYTLFPILAERRHGPGSALSGGQQQMLAIARALMAEPRLLLLDEPSLGLSPVMADEVYTTLAALKADGMTLIVVEEAAGRPLDLADSAVILRNGRIVWQGAAADARDRDLLQRAYLGEHAA